MLDVHGLIGIGVSTLIQLATYGLVRKKIGHLSGLWNRLAAAVGLVLLICILQSTFLAFSLEQNVVGGMIAMTCAVIDVGVRTYIDGGIAPATLLPMDWLRIWRMQWRVSVVVRMIPEDPWRELRENLEQSRADVVAILRDQRRLDQHAAEVEGRLKRFPTPLPDARKSAHDRAKATLDQIDGLRTGNEAQLDELEDLLGDLPAQIYLAQREGGDAEAIRRRCGNVLSALEQHRQAISETNGVRAALTGPSEAAPVPTAEAGRDSDRA